jgi:hypothetical protein
MFLHPDPSILRKENRGVRPEKVFTFTHDFLLLLLRQAISTFVMNSLTLVCPLAVCDLKEMENQAIAPMTGMPPQATSGDVELSGGTKHLTYPAFQEVVITELIMELSQLTVDRVWAAEGE